MKKPSFEHDGYGYLIRYARKQKGKPFCAEDVTLSAIDAGIAPANLKNWGRMFQQAAKDGYIRRSNVAFRRQLGNGTLTLGWVGA